MDQLPHKINTEQSNKLEEILQQMDPSLLQGYKKFMHEVIIQGVSYHDLTFDTLNCYLFNLNKDVMNDIFKKLFLTTRCMHQKKSSPMGIEHVWAMTPMVRAVTSMVFYKTHVVLLITT